MTVPQHVMVSAYHDLTDRFPIMGNFGWENWSRLGKVDVTLVNQASTSATTSINYQDTYHVAIGGQYRLKPNWLLNAGFAYDTSMVKDVDRTLSLPVGSTLIMYLVGDNGSSAEGGMVGMFNEMTYFNGVHETVPDMLRNIDKWGGPETFPHMAASWAVARNTPFMWTKQVASNFGGTRNPLVVSWPARIKASGEIRSQFQHVVDIAPTVLEAVGIPEPKMVNGIQQTPMEGVSMVYTFDDPKAADRHKTQYFEIFSAIALFTTTAGWRRPCTRPHGKRRHGTSSPRTCGNFTTWRRTSARRTTCRRAIRTN